MKISLMCHHRIHSNCKNHAMQMKFLPFYWPLRALKNVLLLNLWKPKCQTNFWSNWCVFRGLAREMLFCISPTRPKSVLPWVIKHAPTAVPWFLFHAFIMWVFFLHSQLHKTSQVCGGWDGQPWWGAILHKPRALSGQWQPVQRMAWSGAR